MMKKSIVEVSLIDVNQMPRIRKRTVSMEKPMIWMNFLPNLSTRKTVNQYPGTLPRAEMIIYPIAAFRRSS